MSTIQVRNVVSPDGGISDNLLPVTASTWVNFNGTGVVSIRGSYNVSSVTDNGIGDYIVNFENNLANANYAGVVSSGNFETRLTSTAVNNFRIVTNDLTSNPSDSTIVTAAIFGDQ